MLTPRTYMPALLGLLLVVACNKDNDKDRQYCDQTGCYACQGDKCYPIPGSPVTPDPNQVTACDNDSTCGQGRVCNLGRCETSCADDASCKSGSACISGRCRPSDSAQCGVAGALCTENTQCGTGRSCVARACAQLCPDNKCVLGQVCSNGACLEDPSPAVSQCAFDYDCGGDKGGFRCINAYCLPNCSDNKQCADGASCVKGTCRADRRGA